MLDLDKKKKYVLACSFGPDSMALFGMLVKENYNFCVAHVNYHKRDISNFEEQAMKDICNKNNIKCYVLDTNKSPYQNGNFQAWARNVRYKFFKQVVELEKCEAVLVAHHLDDFLETYKLQMNRRGLVDYYGIKSQTMIENTLVIRPLLQYSKQELLEFCKSNNIPYSIDVSNYSDDYERNKIRHNFINKLSKKQKNELFFNIKQKNNELMADKIELTKFINDNQIQVDDFLNLNETNQAILLDLYLKRNKITKSFSKKLIKEVVMSLKNGKLNISLGATHTLILEYNFIKIIDLSMADYKITVDKPQLVENQFIRLNLTEKNLKEFRIQTDAFPLTIRPAQDKDISNINNIQKTVKRLYINWKMPKTLRLLWPLIFDKNGILLYVHRYYDKKSVDNNGNFIIKIK